MPNAIFLLHRKQSVQSVVPFKSNTYHRFIDHNEIGEQIDKIASKANENLPERKSDGQEDYSPEKSLTNSIQPLASRPDTKKTITENLDSKEGRKTNRLDGHEKIYSEDPVLNKLLGELHLYQARSITCQNMNRMKKLESKIKRYQVNEPARSISNGMKKKIPGKMAPLSFSSKENISSCYDLDVLVNEILSGKMSSVCPSNAKIVRIFTSSTFTGKKTFFFFFFLILSFIPTFFL